MSEKILFHITSCENLVSIKKNGLNAGADGYVYLFEGVDVSKPEWDDEYVPIDSVIAVNQLGLNKGYVMFVVNVEGLTLEPDNVAEFTSQCQHRFLGDIPKERILNYKYRSAQPYIDLLKELRRA